ncbi:MAG: carbohydrate ABC transporter permease [Epulopiscium sp.]|nr:carbohydrate ABC transporter permease [Candidatus Epulonipiscium sp.]
MKKSKMMNRGIAYILLILFAFIFLLPFIYALYTSFLDLKDLDHIVHVSQLTLDNYKRFWNNDAYNIPRWYFNSITMTTIIIGGNIIINTMAAYALAKLEFPGKKIISFIIVGTMMIPYHMILIPVYVKMAKLGWLNTFASLTIPYLYQCLYIFMLRQFFISIPDSLMEAARIDGLTKIGAFTKILLPLSKPSIVTMIILAFTGTWNSYLIPSTMVNRKEMFVLVVGLNSVKDQFFERTNLVMAGVVITTLPVILIFLIFQKQYVEGVATSGIKG